VAFNSIHTHSVRRFGLLMFFCVIFFEWCGHIQNLSYLDILSGVIIFFFGRRFWLDFEIVSPVVNRADLAEDKYVSIVTVFYVLSFLGVFFEVRSLSKLEDDFLFRMSFYMIVWILVRIGFLRLAKL